MFNASTVEGVLAGRVHCTYRRWSVVRPRVGSRFTTRGWVLGVTSIEAVREDELTDADATESGFASIAALLRWTAGKGTAEGDLYRIGLELVGPDPRISLRSAGDLPDAELASLRQQLARMDRAAPEPWTHQVLAQIARSPGVVSTELAADAGQERAYYKIRVRRLKALGLTESLEVGYRLSPRGAAYLAAAAAPTAPTPRRSG